MSLVRPRRLHKEARMGEYVPFRPLGPDEVIDRAAINDIGRSLTSIHECMHDFRAESGIQRQQILDALGIDAQTGAPARKTLLSMSQFGAFWRVAAAIGTALVALPLAAKIGGAIWNAVIPVLLK